MRLAERADARSLSPERFLALAATTMRRVLVDAARRRTALRRDAGNRQSIESAAESASSAPTRDVELLALDDTLLALADADPELARLVELRVFCGYDVEALAAALHVSTRTVKRRWAFARSWLAHEILRTREHLP